jgi:POT family proton-dependent oligopeptide transporter
MGINIGAFAAPLVTGWLAQSEEFRAQLIQWGLDPLHAWHWGFGSAGVGMTFGMWVYVRRINWIKHIGDAPSASHRRPWLKLCFVFLGTALLLTLMILSDTYTWIAYLIYALPPLAVIYFGLFRQDEESRRIAAIFVFFIAAVLFWAVFEQAGSSLTLFADELTRNEIWGKAFPSAWFQSVNSLFVMALAPVFAWLWIKLGTRQPSVPFKFALGLVFLGLSFLLMVPASQFTAAGKVSPWWLIAVYFLQTLGEMCLSPVGLSTMTKLAPERLTGLIMGIWFLATSLGNKLAGDLAGDFSSKDPAALSHFFSVQAMIVGGMTLLLFALVPWVKKLMGPHHHGHEAAHHHG